MQVKKLNIHVIQYTSYSNTLIGESHPYHFETPRDYSLQSLNDGYMDEDNQYRYIFYRPIENKENTYQMLKFKTS